MKMLWGAGGGGGWVGVCSGGFEKSGGSRGGA